jgi:hypothetical protein
MALNILTFQTHESYQYELTKTGHNFFHMISNERPNGWNESIRPIPKNVSFINESEINLKNFDILLTQSQEQNLKFCGNNSIKKINLEHTYPMSDDLRIDVDANIKIYISESSKKAWKDGSGYVINHGIDISEWPECNYKNNNIISTVNHFKQRDWACGYSMFEQSVSGMPHTIYGSMNDDIGGFPTTSFDEMKKIKSENLVYLNTTLKSPIPFSLLEAMACGMIVVSTPTCEIPRYINHNRNGIFCKDSKSFKIILNDILKNKNKYIKLGKQARLDIKNLASIDLFINKWNLIFKKLVS